MCVRTDQVVYTEEVVRVLFCKNRIRAVQAAVSIDRVDGDWKACSIAIGASEESIVESQMPMIPTDTRRRERTRLVWSVSLSRSSSW